MNTLEDICALAGFVHQKQSACCPFKGYRNAKVSAVVRVSSTMRFIFENGSTFTVGHKTRYATFPRKSHLIDIVSEALQELTEKHPLTKNRYVTEAI